MPLNNYTAEYYKDTEDWKVKGPESKIIFEYTLEDVPVEIIKYYAKKEAQLKEDKAWKELPDNKRFELLTWFQKDVFPTKEFGTFLLKHITSTGPEGLENLFKLLKDKNEYTDLYVTDDVIKLQDEIDEEQEISSVSDEDRKDVETISKTKAFFREVMADYSFEDADSLYETISEGDEDSLSILFKSVGCIPTKVQVNRAYFEFLNETDIDVGKISKIDTRKLYYEIDPMVQKVAQEGPDPLDTIDTIPYCPKCKDKVRLEYSNDGLSLTCPECGYKETLASNKTAMTATFLIDAFKRFMKTFGGDTRRAFQKIISQFNPDGNTKQELKDRLSKEGININLAWASKKTAQEDRPIGEMYYYECGDCGNIFAAESKPLALEDANLLGKIKCPKCGSGRIHEASKKTAAIHVFTFDSDKEFKAAIYGYTKDGLVDEVGMKIAFKDDYIAGQFADDCDKEELEYKYVDASKKTASLIVLRFKSDKEVEQAGEIFDSEGIKFIDDPEYDKYFVCIGEDDWGEIEDRMEGEGLFPVVKKVSSKVAYDPRGPGLHLKRRRPELGIDICYCPNPECVGDVEVAKELDTPCIAVTCPICGTPMRRGTRAKRQYKKIGLGDPEATERGRQLGEASKQVKALIESGETDGNKIFSKFKGRWHLIGDITLQRVIKDLGGKDEK